MGKKGRTRTRTREIWEKEGLFERKVFRNGRNLFSVCTVARCSRYFCTNDFIGVIPLCCSRGLVLDFNVSTLLLYWYLRFILFYSLYSFTSYCVKHSLWRLFNNDLRLRSFHPLHRARLFHFHLYYFSFIDHYSSITLQLHVFNLFFNSFSFIFIRGTGWSLSVNSDLIYVFFYLFIYNAGDGQVTTFSQLSFHKAFSIESFKI